METKATQDKEKTAGTEKGNLTSATGTTTGATSGQTGGRTGGQTTTTGGTGTAGGQAAGSATQRSPYQSEQGRTGEWEDIKERGAEMADRAKQTVSEAYERTSRNLNEGYRQAMDYGREHPGQTALICFGIGVGVGLWLGSTVSPRSRTSRIVPPVMNALSDIAAEIFR
jgi:ElaB/YqjD/DUF883 family membrane-anchored ribosome-binding protein